MHKITEIISQLPEMKSGDELISALTVLPEYDDSIRNENKAVRLMALSDLYQLYIPSSMSIEIYSKLYLALVRSLQKKCTKEVMLQQKENFKIIRQQESRGIIGGSDSFTIIAPSGTGKSSAVGRAMELIARNGVIEVDHPYNKIIPCLVVQTPFDSSVKGLLLEILRKVDECLDSKYHENAIRARATTDMLIGSVSQVALNHIGLLIVDEIQNVVNSKHGKSLVGMLTQLINNSGISICMIGTPESAIFFEQAMQLARRSLGLTYNTMEYGPYFQEFCRILFSYQYVKERTEISESVMRWLYEHSAGIISVVISLVHDAQEIAILSEKEVLDVETLNEAYKKRLSFMHGYIEPTMTKGKQTSAVQKKVISTEIDKTEVQEISLEHTISELVSIAKAQSMNVVQLLKNNITIEEVVI